MNELIRELKSDTLQQLQDEYLIEALELYHKWIKEGVIKPRENQLIKSGQPYTVVPINVPSVWKH